ncbi:cytochrome P450 4C1-like [Epargyreus clarus]|uniref:cytochrome P450 4C1-like n=1 Tax=Epargyreus clarus TaxID=520877 RepID=UPI003C30E412
MMLLSNMLFVVVCILYWVWKSQRKNGEPPPLSGCLPLLGHIHLVVGGSNRIIQVIKRGTKESFEKGYALTFWMGPKPIYVLTDPDDCLTVANTCFETTYSFGKEVFGNGLLMCPVSTWKRHRKLINPAFNQQVLDEFMPIFNKQARRLVADFKNEVGNGLFDNLPYLRRNTLQTICLTAMGIDITEHSELNVRYLESFDKILGLFVERFMKLWLHFDFIYERSEFKKRQDIYLDAFHSMSATVLKRKKEQLKINGAVISDLKQKSFIDMLLENGVFTDLEVKEEVDTFIAAGHETTATLLVFILVLIGSFPEVQDKIIAEFEKIFENRDTDGDLTRQDLSRLQYLEAVIKETLRYYSLVPFVLRRLDRDITLKNYTLPAGNSCMLLYYALHRHPMWGPEADEFKPERWFDSASLPDNPNAFAGFSMGKRNCIGRNFAMMTLKTIVVHLLRNYRIRSDHRKLEFKVDFVFRASRGYYISLEPRK